MVNVKTNKFLVFLFCLYAYSFTLNRGTIIGYIITYGIPAAYMLVNFSWFKRFFLKLTISQAAFLSMSVILIALSYVVPWTKGTDDFSYVRTTTYVFRKLLLYSFLSMVIIKKYGRDCAPEHFMYYFSVATTVYVVVTVIMVFIGPVKTFWMSIVASEESAMMPSSFGYSFRIGWMGVSGFRATLKCTVSVAFLSYIGLDERSEVKLKPASFAILTSISVLGNMFYGRSGLFVSVVVLAIALIINKKITSKMVFRLLLGIIVVFFLILVLQNVSPMVNNWFIWFSTPFKNLFSTGSFSNASFSTLVEDMYFKVSSKTLWSGDGKYTTEAGRYYMRTDAGFMRNILFWGLPLSLLSYVLSLLPLWDMGNRFRTFAMIFMIVFVAMEFKGLVWFEFGPLLYALSCIELNRKRTRRLNNVDISAAPSLQGEQ